MPERNSNGKFAPGNSGGPGRPKRVTELTYQRAVVDAVGVADWMAVVRAAVEQAKAGDAKARDWLTRHLVGEPVAASKLAAAAIMDPDGDEAIVRELASLLRDGRRAEAVGFAEYTEARQLVAGSPDEPEDDDEDDD